jgi:hypothetical protein
MSLIPDLVPPSSHYLMGEIPQEEDRDEEEDDEEVLWAFPF